MCARSLIVQHFHSVANKRGAKVEARMKEFESLRDKIIENAKAAAEEGKSFEFSKINDLNGIRLITPFRSDLTLPLRRGFEMNSSQMKAYYADLLNIPIKSIERVDFKGNLNEMINGKFYRAIHLTISMHGVPAEVQIMSESMATWHHWDHPTVYKTKVTDLNYKKMLKTYSQFWAKLIRNVEDFDGTSFSADQIRTLIVSYGLGEYLNEYYRSASIDWLLKIDQAYGSRYGIAAEDRFLGPKSVLNPSDQIHLFRSLAQPTLF